MPLAQEHDGDEEHVAKRQRGARGGQRHVVKATRRALRPYGGLDLMEVRRRVCVRGRM